MISADLIERDNICRFESIYPMWPCFFSLLIFLVTLVFVCFHIDHQCDVHDEKHKPLF